MIDIQELITRFNLDLLGLCEVFNNAKRTIGDKFTTTVPTNRRALNGHYSLVTGGNKGVGRSVVEKLLKSGSDVLIACRDTQQAQEMISSRETFKPFDGCKLGCLEVASVDLSSIDSVNTFINSFISKNRLLDLIVCNAGIMAPPKRTETMDGFESQFQVNFLSHFLLANKLLALSANQAKARVVFLSSLTHFGAKIDKNMLELDSSAYKTHSRGIKYNAFSEYANSKLFMLLAAKEMNRRMKGGDLKGECAVAVHPGIVDTYLARNYFKNELPAMIRPVIMPLLENFIFPLFLLPPKSAAETVMYACTGPVAEVGGQYIADGRVKESSALSNDIYLQNKVWNFALSMMMSQ